MIMTLLISWKTVKKKKTVKTPCIGKTPWRRERLPTPVFWPGEFHALYSPWGHKEQDMTESLSLSLTFQKPWPKALPLVLTNLMSNPLGTQICTLWDSFKMPSDLAPASFDPQLIKGEML